MPQVLHHVDGIVWETDLETGLVTYINTEVHHDSAPFLLSLPSFPSLPSFSTLLLPPSGAHRSLQLVSQKTKEILGREVKIGDSISAQVAPLLEGPSPTIGDTGGLCPPHILHVPSHSLGPLHIHRIHPRRRRPTNQIRVLHQHEWFLRRSEENVLFPSLSVPFASCSPHARQKMAAQCGF